MNRSGEDRTTAVPSDGPDRQRPPSQRPRQSRWRAARDALALYAAVAAGSMIGGVLRAVASLVFQGHAAAGFPWATLFVNVTGSLMIGFYATLTGPDGRVLVSSRRRQFFMTGICGGYTTFSVFSLETFQLLLGDDAIAAALNVGISVATWLAAVWLGHFLASGLNRLKGS